METWTGLHRRLWQNYRINRVVLPAWKYFPRSLLKPIHQSPNFHISFPHQTVFITINNKIISTTCHIVVKQLKLRVQAHQDRQKKKLEFT